MLRRRLASAAACEPRTYGAVLATLTRAELVGVCRGVLGGGWSATARRVMSRRLPG